MQPPPSIAEWERPVVAGRRLGVSRTRVRQLIEKGRLTGYLTPLGYLIDPESLERLIEERASSPRAAELTYRKRVRED